MSGVRRHTLLTHRTHQRMQESVLTFLPGATRVTAHGMSNGNRLGIGLTNPERLCLGAMGSLQAEAEPTMSFTQFFAQWLNREGISLADYFPQTLVNALNPANSLRIKYDHVTQETTCSRWWTQIQEMQCTN
jgi:hypothetical protein